MLFIDKGFMQRKHVIKPEEAAEEDLLFVHTKRYINSLKVCDEFLCLISLGNLQSWGVVSRGLGSFRSIRLPLVNSTTLADFTLSKQFNSGSITVHLFFVTQ